jgi:BlaI family transcriptional regulator, penicillinase repressor
MARRRTRLLTEREAEIMRLLWERGSATAEEVRSALNGEPHDSTVRTLLRVLEAKGHIRHTTQGKTYVYRPVMAQDKAQRTALRNLLARFFGGSAESLVLRLLEEEHLSAEDLEELLRSSPKSKKKRDEGGPP